MRSKTALQIAALLVIVLTNAVALGGAWWNRSGEAESRLDLSERELKMPFSGFVKSSGLAFALAWRVGVAAEAGEANLDWDENRSARWLDRAKMESLGFDLSDVRVPGAWDVTNWRATSCWCWSSMAWRTGGRLNGRGSGG